MQIFEAPEYVPNPTRLFLGGGITACPNWQADAIERLNHIDELVVLNPRREDFPIDNPSAAQEQIEWEHKMLRRADVICFWFPCETLCPITLYELGYWTERDPFKEIVVGVHEEYARRQDIEIQTRLTEADIPIEIGFDNFIWRLETTVEGLIE